MGFAKTFEKWDSIAGTGGGVNNDDCNKAMLQWLEKNEIPNTDNELDGEANIKRQRDKKRLLKKPPDAVLDLHGKTKTEAVDEMEIFFNAAHARGLEKVQIIHGKGIHSAGTADGSAALDKVVTKFLESCIYAGETGHSSGSEGGSGSRWVFLK
jgi:DNA-nicking Smr family endonuclease